MKEEIYTIPVVDAFKDTCNCPFCTMYKKLEEDAINYMLGPSYMEDDIRMDTNKMGFCKVHNEKMYLLQNRLGLALMTQTHVAQINKDLEKMSKELLKGKIKKPLFAKPTENVSAKMVNHFNKIQTSCYICNKIDYTFNRYLETYFYLWAKKPEIVEYTKNTKGFCIKHFTKIIEMAETKLTPEEFNKFVEIVLPIEQIYLKELENDLDWFVQKFDYRFSNEPWKNSKDALVRGINTLVSSDLKD